MPHQDPSDIRLTPEQLKRKHSYYQQFLNSGINQSLAYLAAQTLIQDEVLGCQARSATQQQLMHSIAHNVQRHLGLEAQFVAQGIPEDTAYRLLYAAQTGDEQFTRYALEQVAPHLRPVAERICQQLNQNRGQQKTKFHAFIEQLEPSKIQYVADHINRIETAHVNNPSAALNSNWRIASCIDLFTHLDPSGTLTPQQLAELEQFISEFKQYPHSSLSNGQRAYPGSSQCWQHQMTLQVIELKEIAPSVYDFVGNPTPANSLQKAGWVVVADPGYRGLPQRPHSNNFCPGDSKPGYIRRF